MAVIDRRAFAGFAVFTHSDVRVEHQKKDKVIVSTASRLVPLSSEAA